MTLPMRQAGAKLVEIGTDEGRHRRRAGAAITDKTAAILYFYNVSRMEGLVPLEQGIEIAKRHGVPLIVDAAAQIPAGGKPVALYPHGRRPGPL